MPLWSARAPYWFAFASVTLLAACGNETAQADSSARVGSATRRNAVAQEPYRDTIVTRGGTVTGVALLESSAPPDTTFPVTSDQGVCGERAARTAPLVHSGKRLGEVVVWLEGVRAGKRLPAARRFTLTNKHCRLEPRVQAMVVGGTLNVKNGDPAAHAVRFVQAELDSTLAVVRLTDAGQLVPRPRILAMQGRVEVRCDRHPWTRGWIVVFGHPYFAVTQRGGAFTLDSVPPGRYRLVAWHERFGTRERTVTVDPGAKHREDLVF